MDELAVINKRAHEFNPQELNVKFETHRSNNSGSCRINMTFDGKKLSLQTHRMVAPFGFSDRGFTPGVTIDMDDSERTQKFMEGIEQLDNLVVEHVFSIRKQLGLYGSNTDADADTLENFRQERFYPSVRKGDPKYHPKLNFQFQTYREKLQGKTTGRSLIKGAGQQNYYMDKNGTPVIPSMETIPRWSRVVIVMDTPSVWISAKGKIGLNWTITQLKIFEPAERPEPASTPNKPSIVIDSDEE